MTKELKPIRTHLQVPGGMNQAKANLLAVKYAIENEVNVEFRFSGKVYQVIFNDLILIPKEIIKEDKR